MKKTLLALAAITASTAAFAQSSVTLYGVVDVSVESVRADKTVTRVSPNNLASSRLGFKGTEDLGGGLKANFVLETPINPDVGSTATNFWDRAAWVGLAGSFGDLRLGRIDTPIGEIAGGSILSAQAFDDLKMIPTRAGNSYRRASNAITYFLPALVPGLSISMQYSTGTGPATANGGEISGEDAGKTFGMAVKYAAGPLSAGFGMLSAKDEVSGSGVGQAGNQSANAALAYAGYDFGAAKVTLYHNAETTRLAKRMTVSGAKIAVPFSPEFMMVAGLSTARNVNGSAAGDDNAHITTLKGIYSLSKRTAAYAMFTNVNNGANTFVGVTTPTIVDRTTRGIAVGLRHSF